MIDIILCGCGGHMGAFVAKCVESRDDMRIVAGIDIYGGEPGKFPVYTSFADVTEKADAVIDFSNPAALSSLLDYCTAKSVPAVICTTGLSEEQKQEIADASKRIPVFFSANMSLGVNLICELAKTAAKVLGNSFDIEIVEAHHNQKLDAPSGTALMIADCISDSLDYDAVYEYDRHSKREKRSKTEIGIHSVRGGTIVGEHEVIFAGNDEIIKISHSARSKALFATGAVNAAAFLCGREPGLYSMADMIR